MRICPQCNTEMEEGYRIKVNAYGVPAIEKGEAKSGGIRVTVCFKCGEISLSLAK